MSDTARLSLACHCGAALSGSIRPAEHVYSLTAAFRRLHQRPACGQATLAEAAAARRRQARDRRG